MKTKILSLTLAAASSSLVLTAQASGFKLNEQSASGVGTAYAGRTAVVEDATTVFYNPAGMSKLKRAEISLGGTYLNADVTFKNGERTNTAGVSSHYEPAYSNGGSLIPEKVIPFVYYAHPVNDKLALGFGVFVPLGAETNYSKDALSGGFAGKTKLTTIDFQPAFSYKLTDNLAIGGGLDIMYAKGELSKQLDLVPFVPAALGAYHPLSGNTSLNDPKYMGYENTFNVEGDDIALGWNLGVMWDITPATTLGLTYRSQVKFTLEGDAEFAIKDGVKAFNQDVYQAGGVDVGGTKYFDGIVPVDLASKGAAATGQVPNQKAKVPLTAPQSATVSLAHQLTDALQLQGGITWTDWSSFKYFDVIGKEPGMISELSAKSTGLTDNYMGHIVEKWHDSFAYALGASYTLNPQWLLRAGFAYDESPVNKAHRTARVPDNDRKWVTAGARFAPTQDISFDLGLAYAFIKSFSMEEVDYNLNDVQSSKQKIKGDYDLNAFGASLQMNYRF
ncbi:MAG: outer membrane protein transport protein [Venatoribacter sp.]